MVFRFLKFFFNTPIRGIGAILGVATYELIIYAMFYLFPNKTRATEDEITIWIIMQIFVAPTGVILGPSIAEKLYNWLYPRLREQAYANLTENSSGDNTDNSDTDSIDTPNSMQVLVEAAGGDDSIDNARIDNARHNTMQNPELASIPICPISRQIPHTPMMDIQYPQQDDMDRRSLLLWFNDRSRAHPLTGETVTIDRFKRDVPQYEKTKNALHKLSFRS